MSKLGKDLIIAFKEAKMKGLVTLQTSTFEREMKNPAFHKAFKESYKKLVFSEKKRASSKSKRNNIKKK